MNIFLVYGWECYEYPCQPIKAFASEIDATAFIGVITEYNKTKPEYPSGVATDDEHDSWHEAFIAWQDSHPSRDAVHRDGFSVMPLELVP